ncbi:MULTISPECIES: WecB/TagA/CpsF family glycosyltransferase [unclassified Rathayibacter]|uniref:WecB/TagA/CpsF family glycosyltransferase n=1 Tax=unclassified Rathayibacter TaxID=2609250 RepID=UPI001C6356A9|nr:MULTISPECIES: WecB/TagA/CpsF family glycosyltransferase [unclassified Rathayibacter]
MPISSWSGWACPARSAGSWRTGTSPRGRRSRTWGGCLDYIAGTQALAPRWMGALGVEWLFRLARDPRRLAARYLLEPLQLLRIVLSGRSRAKRTPGPCDSPRPSGRVSTGVGPH